MFQTTALVIEFLPIVVDPNADEYYFPATNLSFPNEHDMKTLISIFFNLRSFHSLMRHSIAITFTDDMPVKSSIAKSMS